MKIALLIDADNTQPQKMDAVVDTLASRGRMVVRRAFGNWRKDTLKGWEDVLKRHSIKAEQQFDYVSGKNATDMLLTIAALDLLHRGDFDSFAIVSSDSDFTPLAIYLREAGKQVLGFGKQQTAEAFRNSCDEFILLEKLPPHHQPESCSSATCPPAEPTSASPPAATASGNLPKLKDIHQALREFAESHGNAKGYVATSKAANHLHILFPGFRVRAYGAASMTTFCRKHNNLYEVKKEGGGTQVTAYYRIRQAAATPQPVTPSQQTPAPKAGKSTAPVAPPPSEPSKSQRSHLDLPAEVLHQALHAYASTHADAEAYAYAAGAATAITRQYHGQKIIYAGEKKLLTFLEQHPALYALKRVPRGVAFGIYYRCLSQQLSPEPLLPGFQLQPQNA